MSKVEDIKRDLEKMLSEYRYLHCLRVADVAKRLACLYSYDLDKAYIAGLVHDIAKEFTIDENVEYVKKYSLPNYLLDKEYAKMIHADIGACIARDWYSLDDEICHAIKSHSIGDIPMNLLDKIIFVADKIEPMKRYDGISEERSLASRDIHGATILCILNNHKKLIKEHKKIYPKSLEVLEYLKNNKE